jgi:hypothetical protein
MATSTALTAQVFLNLFMMFLRILYDMTRKHHGPQAHGARILRVPPPTSWRPS